MTKLVLSTTEQVAVLQREVERQSKEISSLVEQVKTLRRLKGLPAGSNPQGPPAVSPAKPAASPPGVRHYMLPTGSFQARTRPSQPKSAPSKADSEKPVSSLSINGGRYKYTSSGCLSCLDHSWARPAPGFMRSTIMSEARKASCPTDAQQRIREFTRTKSALFNKSRETPEPSTSATEQSWTGKSDPDPNFSWSSPSSDTLTDNAENDEQHHIAPSPTPHPAGLDQNWIVKELALANCFQNHALAMEFASTALTLGKEALWHWARDHEPELFERLSPFGANMIPADWTELRDATKTWKLAPQLRWDLEGLAKLRNFVAHPKPMFNLAVYDKFAQLAEDLI